MRAAIFMVKTLAVITSLLGSSDLFAQQGERRCEYRDGTIVGAMWSCPMGTIDVTPRSSRPLTGPGSIADRLAGPLIDQMNRSADRREEILQGVVTANANQRRERRFMEALQNADIDFNSRESRTAVYALLIDHGFRDEAVELRQLFDAEDKAQEAEEDRARQRQNQDLQDELLRLQIDALSNSGNAAVANQLPTDPATLGGIVQALTDSSRDGLITDAELSGIADRASSISSDFGQAFTVTRSFIVQSAAADTDPNAFADIESQMRLIYGNLDRDQTLVMIDFVLREAVAATRMSNEAGNSSSNTRGQDLVTGLNSLNDLHERGLLNEEEFNAAKRRLLGL